MNLFYIKRYDAIYQIIAILFVIFSFYPRYVVAGSEMEGSPAGLNLVTKGSSIISPENDSRLNLYLLWRDQNKLPAPNFHFLKNPTKDFLHFNLAYQDDELLTHVNASRVKPRWYRSQKCQSVERGRTEFQSALEKDKSVPFADKKILSARRDDLVALCNNEDISFYIPNLSNAASTQDFYKYWKGSLHFYTDKFEDALEKYQDLHKSENPWIREASLYMTARTRLNLLQKNAFSRWGDFEGLPEDQFEIIPDVLQTFKRYLDKYPSGRYAGSARGLLRRIYWLSSDYENLISEYKKIDSAIGESTYFQNLIPEIDNKILLNDFVPTGTITDPAILGARLMLVIRESEESPKSVLNLIENNQKTLKQLPGLYELILGNFYLHFENNPKKTLEFLSEKILTSAQISSIDFSLRFLKGSALNYAQDLREGAYWQNFLEEDLNTSQRGPVEGWLADYWLTHNLTELIFETRSPISNTSIRRSLFSKSVSLQSLETSFEASDREDPERHYALFILLLRHLFDENYEAFINDASLINDKMQRSFDLYDSTSTEQVPLGVFYQEISDSDYVCPKRFLQVVEKLAINPRDSKNRLCLALFYEQQNFATYLSWVHNYRGVTEIYSNIIDSEVAPREDQAYALYRSILCYKYGTFRCDGKPVKISQRKLWFEKLKLEFEDTKWSKKVKHFW